MNPYLKAFTAAFVAGLGTLQVAYSDQVITTQEIVGIVIATLVALAGVYAVPNTPKNPVRAYSTLALLTEEETTKKPPTAGPFPPPSPELSGGMLVNTPSTPPPPEATVVVQPPPSA